MEATHDIDFVLWCLEPRKPVKVYAQDVRKIMGAEYKVPDCVWAATTRETWTSVVCLAASFFLLEWVIGPEWAVPMDVGGQFSGTVTGIMNMAGALGASLTPLVFGYFIQRGSWVAPFFGDNWGDGAGHCDLDILYQSRKIRGDKRKCVT
jgi:hypothetical protein